jgi:phosphoribosylaminoimidazole-succinocarboxamide synthase
MKEEDWVACEKIAAELFEFGQKTALEHGLILVDTKYEFGKDSEGPFI